MIEYVIFDLDGTLLDTTDGVVESAIYAAKKLNCNELPLSTMLNFVGPPIQESFMKYYGFEEEKAQKAAEIFRSYYKSNALFKAKPYDGIYELCESLIKKGIKLAVATYKREDYALTILRYFKFDKYCLSMRGADNNNILKKSDIIELCIADLGADKNKTVLVGDTVYDAIGAQNALVGFIGVTYGFGFHNKSEVSVHSNVGVAASPLEILNFIK